MAADRSQDGATVTPYGAWPSPLDAAAVAGGTVRLAEPRSDGDDLYWLEARPEAEGRIAIVHRAADGTTSDLVATPHNVRTRVHEYGGGAYLVRDGVLWFSEFSDQRLYRVERGVEPYPITPEPPEPASVRYADGVLSADGRWIICVRETHPPGHDASTVVNELVAVPSDGDGEHHVLATGRDFYASPRLSPDGTELVWQEWDHPDMPWDGCELRLARFEGDPPTLTDAVLIAGGPDESVGQLQWSERGVLHLLSDRTGWWNLYRVTAGGELEALDPVEAEVGEPQWVFGQSRYALVGDLVVEARFERGADRLQVIGPGGPRPLDVDTASARYLVAHGDRVVLVSAPSDDLPAVVAVDPRSGGVEVLRRARALPVDASYLSRPEAITFPTGDGDVAHALYYPPRNPDVEGPADERPPLLVETHGGPSAHVTAALNLAIQYWTTRGFGVVDVNYRGSTGYGRRFRNALRGRWGPSDREDVVAAARFLAGRGDADPQRLAIRGGSAGGFTTLSALTFEDVFAAGASYFGVADIEALVAETHKLESRYLDRLIGPYPETRETYVARSPVHHTEGLSAPMILFQGLEDEVVPPAQAEVMVAALEAKGLPYAYLAFAGEQHGFRRAETMIRCLEAELAFYAYVFGFEPADALPPLEITNA